MATENPFQCNRFPPHPNSSLIAPQPCSEGFPTSPWSWLYPQSQHAYLDTPGPATLPYCTLCLFNSYNLCSYNTHLKWCYMNTPAWHIFSKLIWHPVTNFPSSTTKARWVAGREICTSLTLPSLLLHFCFHSASISEPFSQRSLTYYLDSPLLLAMTTPLVCLWQYPLSSTVP